MGALGWEKGAGAIGPMGVEMVFSNFDLLNKRGSQRDLSEIQLYTETNSEEYTYKRNFKKRFKGIQKRNQGGGRDHEGLEKGFGKNFKGV